MCPNGKANKRNEKKKRKGKGKHIAMRISNEENSGKNYK
jgi:hypothetical protein